MILDKISMIRKAPSVILDKIFLINKAPSVMLNTATSFNDGEEKVVCGNTGLRNFRPARYTCLSKCSRLTLTFRRSWIPVITQIGIVE